MSNARTGRPMSGLALMHVCLGVTTALTPVAFAEKPNLTDEQQSFFESKIRPVLVEHCYSCHNSIDAAEADLVMDWRGGMLAGSLSGPIMNQASPGTSLLVRVLRHEIDGLEMPDGGPKLDDSVIADFERWIGDGAPDPRTTRPTEESLAAETSWEASFERRKQWWSLQPITNPAVPDANGWSEHPVDRFIERTWSANDIAPAEDADAHTVLRRLHYVLTGLPATIETQSSFFSAFARDPQRAVVAKVDELLNSPQFGERWARHWMDWVRYSEGSGGQGDPVIENAHEYRDYLIRALNADVPYDQLVKEHIAGDLLESPRINNELGINESIIGLGHFRFVEHGFFPVDVLDELVKFTDNQIDVVSKTFLGLTVSCARCHDHKFDAISQADYHAMFGIFASSRPALRPISDPQRIDDIRDELKQTRRSFALELKRQWLGDLMPRAVEERLTRWSKKRAETQAAFEAGKDKPPKNRPQAPKPIPNTHPLHAWDQWQDVPDLDARWRKLAASLPAIRSQAITHNESITLTRWNLSQGLPDDWIVPDGTVELVSAGELGIGAVADKAVLSILPAGLMSHTATAHEHATLTSPDFVVPNGAVAARWAGAGHSMFRLVPENYPRPGGGLYRQFEERADGQSHLFGQQTDFWKDFRGYIQVMTRQTWSSPAGNPKPDPFGSWFHIADVRLLNHENDRLREERIAITPLLARPAPHDRDELVTTYQEAIRDVLERWQTGDFDDEDALFLSSCLSEGLLDGSVAGLSPDALIHWQRYRELEASIPASNRSAPGVIDTPGFDQPLYVRGNHRAPAARVERAFLSAIDPTPYRPDDSSGRLQLAHDLVSPTNPLTARVIVNRLWQRVFGEGLVTTADNFGATGQRPTHPELLDHLATQFQSTWSIKQVLRELLTSRVFRLSSQPRPEAAASDPANRWLSHGNVRRFDAEVIRDHMLACSGELDTRIFGRSIGFNTPPQNDRRRGLYVQAKRAGQNSLFAVFDVPMPTTTRGRRDVTTTPSQSVALLNSPFVWHQARKWATKLASEASSESDPDRIRNVIRLALCREPTEFDIVVLADYLQSARRDHEGNDVEAWAQTLHVVFNLKEFIYLR